jgi:15-cis-phytoene synthase
MLMPATDTLSPDTPAPRYFAWLYSVPPQRNALHCLLGIEREVYESLRPGMDHHVAHSRLQWWRDECERAVSGSPVHPLTRELVVALGGGRDQLVGLPGIVDTAIWDLASATFDTRKELTAYCERWAAAMIQPLAAPGLDWREFGTALREIELLAQLASDARYGRLRIPLDELERTGAEPAALAKTPWPDSVAKLLRGRHEDSVAELVRASASLTPEVQLSSRGLLVWATLTRRVARSVARALPDASQPSRLSAIADTWSAWRAARRATLGRFKLN